VNYLAKSKSNKKGLARVGDTIKFTRLEQIFMGEVVNVRENSIIVELFDRDAKEILGIETSRTVVAHPNYEISKRTPNPGEPVVALNPWTYQWQKVVSR